MRVKQNICIFFYILFIIPVQSVTLNPPAQEPIRVFEQTYPIPERPNSQASHFTVLLKLPTGTALQGAVTVALGKDVNEDTELGVEENLATLDLVAQTQTGNTAVFERKTVGGRQFFYARILAKDMPQYDALHVSARGGLPAMNLRLGWEGQPLKIILF